LISSVLDSPIVDSIRALSKASPTVPIEARVDWGPQVRVVGPEQWRC
jgi:hypothetical protein